MCIRDRAWKETVVSARALMEAGQYNEAGVSQMEATYYSVQTSILDLKEQINPVSYTHLLQPLW